MSKTEQQHFMILYVGERRYTQPVMFGEQCAAADTDAGKIFLHRLSLNSTVKLTEALALWLLSMCDRPGLVVAWAYTLARMQRLHVGEILNLSIWTKHFPIGVPTNQAMIDTWAAQKSDKGSNTLDTIEVWTDG